MQQIILALVFLTATIRVAADESDGTAADHSRLFRSADVFNLELAEDPQVSPDGRRVVYARTAMDIMTDKPRSNLWIVDADGSNHRPLLSGRGSDSSPRWSPHGRQLAYISAAEGSPQLYVRWMDTGQTALLTNLTKTPSSISWSPDGHWIAFTMFVPKEKEPLVKPPKKPEGAEWAPPVKVIDTVLYRIDGEGYLESGYTHIFVLPAEGGTPRQLTQGDFNHNGPLSWTPDSRQIVFSTNRRDGWEYQAVEDDLYAIDVDDGRLYRYWFSGPPWEAQDEYWQRSPLSLVGNVTTPTMLINGEADFRTPISEAKQLYQALKLRKVDTILVRVPEARHGIAGRPSDLIAKVDNILAWFERHAPDPHDGGN